MDGCRNCLRRFLAKVFCCCCQKAQRKFIRGYGAFSSDVSIEQIEADCAKLQKLYLSKEDLLLATDYEGNITFVRILRENPQIILRNGDKYESHILEMARIRDDLIQIRETMQIICEKPAPSEPAIKGPDNFDSNDDATARDTVANRDSLVQFLDPVLSESRYELSKKWSERLRERGNLVRPKWPDYLPVVKFEATKVNRIGFRLKRVLTLTQQSILNAKMEDGELKKVYMYNEISLAGLVDENTFAIYMKDGHQINFETDNAAHVVQQLMSRMKFRLRLDRISFSSTDATTKQIISQIAYENAMGHDAYITFAEELKQAFISSITEGDMMKVNKNKVGDGSLGSTQHDGAGMAKTMATTDDEVENPMNYSNNSSGQNVMELTSVARERAATTDSTSDDLRTSSSSSGRASGSGSTPVQKDKRRTNSEAKVAMHQMYKEGSKEHLMQTELRKLLFSRVSIEGCTRLNYTTKFVADGRDQRGVNNIVHKEAVRSYQDFKMNMFEYILKHRGKQLSAMMEGLEGGVIDEEKNNFDVSYVNDIGDENFCNLALIVYNVVEASILDSILEHSFLKRIDAIKKEERELKLRIAVFADRDQRASQIDEEFISPLGWKSAVFELSNLETQLNPWDMLNILIRTSKSIYSEYKHAISIGKQTKALGADDIVPIFIYVFCQSQFSRPVVAKEIMWHLSHPSLLHGECGYYLTIFDSCIQYILNDTMTDAETEKYNKLKREKRY